MVARGTMPQTEKVVRKEMSFHIWFWSYEVEGPRLVMASVKFPEHKSCPCVTVSAGLVDRLEFLWLQRTLERYSSKVKLS